EALRDLALAAARDRARLVTEGALRHRANQTPAGRRRMLLEPHLVAARMQVHLARQHAQRLFLPAVRPAGALRAKVDLHVFGQDVNAREALVRRVALLRDGDRIAQELERL